MQSTSRWSTRWTLPLVLLGIGLLTAGCQRPSPQPPTEADASAGPSDADVARAQQEVIAAHEALVKAYETGNIDAYVALLAPAPELLIFHPAMENRFDGVEEVRRHMAKMFKDFSGAEWTDFHPVVEVDGNVGWITSQVTISSLSFKSPFVGRGTEIWVRRHGEWKLAHGHWSAVPPSRY